MVLRLFYHHILQQYVGIYSVSIPYCFRIVLLSFSYRSPIVLLLGNGKQYGNNTEAIRSRTKDERMRLGGVRVVNLTIIYF